MEVTTDGRHLTFLLTALGEAGYGVHVVGSPFVFRELMCLRQSVPIPFIYGGPDVECGFLMSDRKPSSLVTSHSPHILLDYDYFSGLLERVEPRISRIYTDGQQGDAQGTCAGDAFSNPSTSELARDSENTSLTRSANNPASSEEQSRTDIGGLISDKSEVAKALDAGRSTLDADRRPNAGHSLKEWSGVFEGLSPSSLGSMPSKTPPAPAPGVPVLASSSVLIREIRGQNASSPATSHSPPATALCAPYFMHPSVYHRGLHKKRSPHTTLDTRHSAEGATVSHPLPVTSYPPQRRRRFRLGFFGTHDREFYTKHYHFPGMNRFEVLDVFIQKFGNRIKHLRGFPRDWDPCEMAVSIDSRGGDRRGKTFLSQDHYFEALGECDFVLSPPGWCMPLSHNLIEAMFCGAVPITNGGAFMAEPLADGINSLEFQNEEGLVAVIERALAMDESEVERMRSYVRDYYDRFLEPKAFAEELSRSDCRRVFLNAEENSVPFVFPRKF